MTELVIGNSYSQLKGLQTNQFRQLRSLLSYVEGSETARYYGGWPKRKYLLDKHGFFPTGLLRRVIPFFSTTPLAVRDTRMPPKRSNSPKVERLPFEPYPDQGLAVDLAVKANRGIISMVTGSGKSLVIRMIIQRLNVPTLVVVPNLELKRQLSESLKGLDNVTVENIDCKSLMTARDYGCLIIDEAHHVASKTYQRLNKKAWNGIYHRYYLTATPYRTVKEEQILFEAIAGELIYSLSYLEAVKKNYVVPAECYYIELPKIKTSARTWAQVYSELVVNNQARNEVIAGIMLKLVTIGVSTLCLVKEIQHGNNLQKLFWASFANGQDEESRIDLSKFANGELKSLVATTGIAGEGIDTKPCEYVIIAGLGKAKGAFLQQVGRAIRNYPGKASAKVILFKDPSHKFTLTHFKHQSKIMEEVYGVTPVKLDL